MKENLHLQSRSIHSSAITIYRRIHIVAPGRQAVSYPVPQANHFNASYRRRAGSRCTREA